MMRMRSWLIGALLLVAAGIQPIAAQDTGSADTTTPPGSDVTDGPLTLQVTMNVPTSVSLGNVAREPFAIPAKIQFVPVATDLVYSRTETAQYFEQQLVEADYFNTYGTLPPESNYSRDDIVRLAQAQANAGMNRGLFQEILASEWNNTIMRVVVSRTGDMAVYHVIRLCTTTDQEECQKILENSRYRSYGKRLPPPSELDPDCQNCAWLREALLPILMDAGLSADEAEDFIQFIGFLKDLGFGADDVDRYMQVRGLVGEMLASGLQPENSDAFINSFFDDKAAFEQSLMDAGIEPDAFSAGVADAYENAYTEMGFDETAVEDIQTQAVLDELTLLENYPSVLQEYLDNTELSSEELQAIVESSDNPDIIALVSEDLSTAGDTPTDVAPTETPDTQTGDNTSGVTEPGAGGGDSSTGGDTSAGGDTTGGGDTSSGGGGDTSVGGDTGGGDTGGGGGGDTGSGGGGDAGSGGDTGSGDTTGGGESSGG